MAVLWGEVKEKVDKDISQLRASLEVCVCVCVCVCGWGSVSYQTSHYSKNIRV